MVIALKIIKYVAVIAAVILVVAAGFKIYKDRTAFNSQYDDDTAITTTGDSQTNSSPDRDWEKLLSYAEYLEMTAQERSDFADSFEDSAEFFQWLDAVMEIYEQEQKEDEIGQDGVIDMDKINPNG